MIFEELKKADLLAAAAAFGVDVEATTTKPLIIAALVEDGVTAEMYLEAFPPVQDVEPLDSDTLELPPLQSAPVKPKGRTVLIKMTRANGTYQIRGYTFTKKNPYLPVDEETANYLLEEMTGFKVASPRDAEEFYR